MPRSTNARPCAGGASARPNASTRILDIVTTHREFFPIDGRDCCLFAVQPGVPVLDALAELNTLLHIAKGSASDQANAVDDRRDQADGRALVHLLAFARALSLSITGGLIDAHAAENQSEGGAA